MIAVTWAFTVVSAMARSKAICLFSRPSQTSARIFACWRVSRARRAIASSCCVAGASGSACGTKPSGTNEDPARIASKAARNTSRRECLGMKPAAPARRAAPITRLSASEDTTTTGTCPTAARMRINPSSPVTSGRFRSSTTTSGSGPRSSRARAVSRPSAVSIVRRPATARSVIDKASQNSGWSSTIKAVSSGRMSCTGSLLPGRVSRLPGDATHLRPLPCRHPTAHGGQAGLSARPSCRYQTGEHCPR